MIEKTRLAVDALDRADFYYFTSENSLILYAPCRAKLKYRTIRPSLVKISIIPRNEGLLFIATLPVTLVSDSEENRHQILCAITKENYVTMRGKLVYTQDEQLEYHLFCPINNEKTGFSNEEITEAITACAAGLSDGYSEIVNAIDRLCVEEEWETDFSGNDYTELETIYERLCISDDTPLDYDIAPDGWEVQENRDGESLGNEETSAAECSILLDDFLEKSEETKHTKRT